MKYLYILLILISSSLYAGTNQQIIVDPATCVFALYLNENTGTFCRASYGVFKNTCSILNSSWVTNGYMGAAIQFDGTTDNVRIQDTGDVLSFGSAAKVDKPFTVCAWIKGESMASTPYTILSKGGDGGATTREYVGYLFAASFYVACWNNTSKWLKGEGACTASDYNGKWTFCVFSYDGSESQNGIKTYINGVPLTMTATTSSGYDGMLSAGKYAMFGDYYAVGTGVAVGMTDSIVVYSKVLSLAEINYLYNAQSKRYQGQ